MMAPYSTGLDLSIMRVSLFYCPDFLKLSPFSTLSLGMDQFHPFGTINFRR